MGARPAPRSAPVGPGRLPVCALLLAGSLDAQAAPFAADSPLAAAHPAPAAPAAPERTPLPSYFTVELGTSGALFADGRPLGSSAELADAARAAAAQGTFAGAVLFGDAGSGPALDAVAEVLRRAGFTGLVDARRNAPRELSALARAERERARRERQRLIADGVIEGDAAAGSRSGAPPSRDRTPRVELQTVGLHLAAPANQAATRKRLLAQFERNFGAFRRCHADAPAHAYNASFGVDLLVPAEGGRAKVRQTRTRLSGTAFRACMERAFHAMVFDPPPTARPEMVSYSLLFRPAKR
jgi:hypothetical protein